MRIEITTGHETVDEPRPKVWLTDDDYAQLRDHVGYRDDFVIRLGAKYGLQSFEIPQIHPKDVRDYDRDGEEYHFLRVRRRKDTTGNGRTSLVGHIAGTGWHAVGRSPT